MGPMTRSCPKEVGQRMHTANFWAWPVHIFRVHFPHRLLQHRRLYKLGEERSPEIDGAWVSNDCGKLHWLATSTLDLTEITSEKADIKFVQRRLCAVKIFNWYTWVTVIINFYFTYFTECLCKPCFHVYVTTHDISLWKYLLNNFAEEVGKSEEREKIRF